MIEKEVRQSGTVKWYNRRKGFGFVTPDDGGEEVFLHRSGLQKNSDAKIDSGVRVTYNVQIQEKGPTAVEAALLDVNETSNSTGHGKTTNETIKPKGTPRDEKPTAVKTVSKAVKPKGTPRDEKPTAVKTVSEAVKPKGTPRDEKPKVVKSAEKSTTDSVASREGKEKSKLKHPDAKTDETTFTDLALKPELLSAVQDAGYVQPTPIQTLAIPLLLSGKDLMGCAQTGTGKTAAFALPILQKLNVMAPEKTKKTGRETRTNRIIRALVLAPTRELAIQINDNFTEYGKYTGVKNTVIFGGVGQNPQVDALQGGVDVLVATPGRLLDLIGQGFVKLDKVETVVFDEADRMLDMGFIHDVRRIMKYLPRKRQGMLFSATIPQEIIDLANTFLVDPVEINVSPDQPAVEIIEQYVYFVTKNKKQSLLEYLLKGQTITKALVFTRTKHGANGVVKKLVRAGVRAQPIHGNKSQTARQDALNNFHSGDTRVLVATDVASRGIDVDDISHVIQYELPNVPETYIHRIGRTGRAGAGGIAISFCDENEVPLLKDIERLTRKRVQVVSNHPFKN